MKFSIWPSLSAPYEQTVSMVRAAESWGWHAAYYADHFMPNGPDATPLRGGVNEALTTLGALAADTSTIRLGTLVASATYRHPAVAAKMFITLDHISHGRIIVGLGAGWQENEHASYGIELGSIKERIDRFEEYVTVVASLLANEQTEFHGAYFNLTDAPADPRPVQTPPPLLLGVSGRQRTTRLAAQKAQIWNAWTSPVGLTELNDVLNHHCADLGRDPATLVRTTQAIVHISTNPEAIAKFRTDDVRVPVVVGTPGEVLDTLGRYRDAGCDEFIFPSFAPEDYNQRFDTLSLFNEEVARFLV
jgi:alkanesulfonate monooxygenase SsuD/methylene tetrahydromethanopterin reductase-like flavin-dependent oxidoreductase (luciferase family)